MHKIVALAIALPACGFHHGGDIKVEGSTNHRVELYDSFCDTETYPDAASRRQCKDALIAALRCEGKGKDEIPNTEKPPSQSLNSHGSSGSP